MKWTPVSHDLPPIRQRLLAYGIDWLERTHDIHEAVYYQDGTWRTRQCYAAAPDEEVELEDVTHWMPLPPPPAGTK